jgi:hypothetical protein
LRVQGVHVNVNNRAAGSIALKCAIGCSAKTNVEGRVG